jgi:peptidyl-prolyl cis-trans isomerase SurA
MGFVNLGELDPAVARIVSTMPVGAISDPVRVPGGYDIVQLLATHNVGTEKQTILSIRQAFAQYPQPITNGQVGPVQAAVINKLLQAAHAVHSCPDMAAVNAAFGNVRPSDPGPVNLATVTPPAFQTMLGNLAVGQISEPLVASDGVSVVMVCSRQSQAATLPSDDAITQMIVAHRVELESQQLLDVLQHRAVITRP